MEVQWRKVRLALITFAAILGFYLVYSLFSNTPKITVSRSVPVVQPVGVNEANSNQTVAKVGEVGLGTLEMAKFTTLNPRTKQLEREFGFARLLHQDGQQWEIDKPYMNIYRPDLKCYVTADKGFVVLETGVSPPSPKDATLSGNVVAHIVPEPGSDIEESFIYLDDVMFVSNKSEFSTKGPVKFVSKSAQLLGKGLNLIYDDSRDRLALLRIDKIEDMRFKATQQYSLMKTDETSEVKTADDTSSVETTTETQPSVKEEKKAAKAADTYKCILDGNVLIETKDELIAADRVCISDIVWSDRSSKKTDNTGEASAVSNTEQPVEPKPAPEPVTPEQDIMEITVKCDNGIVLAPDDALEIVETLGGVNLHKKKVLDIFRPLEDKLGRTVFSAEQIDYSVKTTDAVAAGLSHLKFYARDVIEGDIAQTAVPVILTSKIQALFSPRQNQVIFKGDCYCVMDRIQEGLDEQYTLSAPTLVVDLTQTDDSKTDIAFITAIGDEQSLSKLASVRKDEQKFLGGIELKCPRFTYDEAKQLFTATGPGVIKADNSKIPQPKKRVGRFSLQRPCYAVVRNFQSLEYDLNREQITAYNDSERILIDYFPVDEEGQQQVSVTAGRIEADLVETDAGQKRLWALLATNGISFQDQDKMFEASSLFYDDKNSIITAKGDDMMPAYFNGALFDGIEYDLATEKVKNVKIAGPGYIQVAR